MSRRRSPRVMDERDATPEVVIESLLDELCVKFGFCLPPEAKAALRTNPPQGVHSFMDAVIAAEGLDPATYDSAIRGQMVELVTAEAGRIL